MTMMMAPSKAVLAGKADVIAVDGEGPAAEPLAAAGENGGTDPGISTEPDLSEQPIEAERSVEAEPSSEPDQKIEPEPAASANGDGADASA